MHIYVPREAVLVTAVFYAYVASAACKADWGAVGVGDKGG